jgi:hypothetical protein
MTLTGIVIALISVTLILQTIRASAYRKLADLRRVRAEIAEEQLALFDKPIRTKATRPQAE